MNTDTNPCWYIITNNASYCTAARAMLSGAFACSGVLEELIYRLYWAQITESTPLEERDRLRNSTVLSILNLYLDGHLGGDSDNLVPFALDLFRYRRLDWVDSYLIARYVLRGESFGTFDGTMTKTARIIKDAGGKIPVISGYTLSLDKLPSHVFVRSEDIKSFKRAGLLHLDLE